MRLQLTALIEHWHAMHARVIFLDGWFEMGHLVTDVCIFVHEKGHLISKDPNENIVQWRAIKTVEHTQKTTWAYPYIAAEVMSSNPVQAWIFSGLIFTNTKCL